MLEKLQNLKTEAEQKIFSAKNNEELFDIEKKFLGRKGGELSEILKGLKDLPNDQKGSVGKLSNEVKNFILESIEKRKTELEEEYYNSIVEEEFLDISKPVLHKKTNGTRHPISQFIDETISVFGRMGFSLISGDEIENEWYNFTALRLGADHPAREMQDTFFVKDLKDENLKSDDDRDKGYVLRTQTSDMQIHYLQENPGPCAIIGPGKVFRKDSDATHSPMFHQVEGLFVNEKVSIANLKYVLLTAFKEILGDDKIEMRLRLSYFPFTEPSFEVDVSCPICGGKEKSCKVCKGNIWLEIGGAGMVHPEVLENSGVDSKKYNGFAFGFGIDRLVMIKHKINDIRLFYENDIRFLKQF
ncbi:phenylalanine--tRNA ligase subunit alpha [Candidatus Gracilibacteria bacterium]|nr:phenylalanine--tRNA ligase subunit alpha [Candidatus Gracilibacteria bacterium]